MKLTFEIPDGKDLSEMLDAQKHFDELGKQFRAIYGLPAWGTESLSPEKRLERDECFHDFMKERRAEAWALWHLVFGYMRTTQRVAPQPEPFLPAGTRVFQFVEPGDQQDQGDLIVFPPDSIFGTRYFLSGEPDDNGSRWSDLAYWTLDEMKDESFAVELSPSQAQKLVREPLPA